MVKMKILMLNPPFKHKYSRSSRSPAVTKGGTIYYPLWLAYATAALEKEGFEAKLIDAPAENLSFEDVLKVTEEFKPDLIVSETSTASIYSDVEIATKLKKATNAFLVLVGTHPSALPEETLKISGEIDAIAIHEYDYTLREIAQKIQAKKLNLEMITGIAYQKNGKIFKNKDRELIENLDEIPFVSAVYKKHLNIKNYFYSANLYPEITIVTGRGCPYQCKFCVWPQVLQGQAYRKRSIENVFEEFKYIKETFPEAKEIFIEDDTFTADRERVKKFCDLLIKNSLKITWSCNSRADVDLETLQKMKQAGCRLLCVGVESGSQEILNNIRKGTTIEGIKKFMKDSKKAGILVHGCFMLGNQGETKETIRKTIEFAKELNPDTAQFFPIMVYPGTETYEEFKKSGFLTTNKFDEWLTKDGQHNSIISRPGLSNYELVELCDEARREFYLRPKYIFSKIKQAFLHPKEFVRIAKASKTFFKYLFNKKEKQD
ncbi:MAG: radical SAM protein [archaeon]